MDTGKQVTEIPILKRHYWIGSLLPVIMLILLVPAYWYSSKSGLGVIALFGGFAIFLISFSLLHIPYLLMPEKYSLRIETSGIVERTTFRSIKIDWDDIASIQLHAIEGGRKYVTYRLHNSTVSRWFSFGRFDHRHYNQYAIDEHELLELVSRAFSSNGNTGEPIAG